MIITELFKDAAQVTDFTIQETARTGKKSTARIDRILQLLRARNPQAQNDLEALIFDFRNQQAQDRTDIARLDQENDMEEADIERLEQMLNQLRRRRGLQPRDSNSSPGLAEAKKKPQPTNPELWSRAKSAARSKFDVYPSAYANAWAAKWYKSKGGGWRMGKPKKK